MADGDLVILRLGALKVVAVGEVVGGYEWCEEFGDIEGWDMQHVRRVRWLWQSRAEPAIFAPFTLKLGDTTQRINSPVINDWIATLETPAVNNVENLGDEVYLVSREPYGDRPNRPKSLAVGCKLRLLITDIRG
jgi:predicted Mrr-cat superfamily restriction endonuclease